MRPELILTTIILGLFGQSYACKCDGPSTVTESFRSSQLIVYGKVISKDTVALSETIEEGDVGDLKERLKDDKQTLQYLEMIHVLKIELEIIENYKGGPSFKNTVIYTPLRTASCGFRFEIDEVYIVYASKDNFLSFLFRKEAQNNQYQKDGTFWTSHCTRTTKYTNSEADELRLMSGKND